MKLVFLAFVNLSLMGCLGQSVDRLRMDDPRLPNEAKRWVGDAEDAVIVARARYSDKLEELKAMDALLVAAQTSAPLGGQGGPDAQMKREKMSLSRVEHARAEVDLSKLLLSTVEAKLTLAYAETAMRHDLAVYDLEPLQKEVETLNGQVQASRERARISRQNALVDTDAFWKAWRTYSAAGNDTSAFWKSNQL